MPDFVHLHCHTEYSLLDGAIKLGDLCDTAKSFNMPACAITDHGNLFAAANFFVAAKKAGIKPIIGCEVYTCHDHTDRTSELARRRNHLVLLAQNAEGYRNLVKIVTQGYLDGFHYKPRVDKGIIAKYSGGLIGLSACLAGEIPRKLLNEGFDAALEVTRQYQEIFPDRFYLELQSNGLKEQDELNDKLIELADHTGLPLVATNDCHYLKATDVEAHDTLLCIQTAACVTDEKRMRFDTTELYYKSPDEMAEAFRHVPESIENTVKIAEQCNFEMEMGKYYFPVYELPEGMTMEEEFRRMCEDGLRKRLEKVPYEVDEAKYWERLNVELDVINTMGFPAYFLIVQDFINWAKDHNIPVGPGRGSAAGSLVAWSLRITNLDPLPYDLLFERFLNIERVSMPDIDVDFCERRRVEVIKYVAEKYGHDTVGQITTFGKMKAKAVVRDVGRAHGFSFADTDRIAKLIPDDLKMTIGKALEQEPELANLVRTDERVSKLISVAQRLEGLSRHASTHAAGVVIGDKPLNEFLPLYRGKKDEIVTQFDMKMVEKVGLVKFDFLGLRTMTVVQDSLDNIKLQGKEPPDLDNLPLDDAEVYRLYQRGDTDGIFQVESSGMRTYLRQLKPTCFDDVIAMLALYRPGPLNSGMVDEFIKRKHGEVEVTYPHPLLEDCLKATYGVIVYQEQVMQIAQIIAKYSLGGADLLRRAMGKKNAAAMAEERGKFLAGAKDNNIEKKTAEEIFDLMEKFAEYGFNKSHSAAYALISYYTAYLKTYFPAEFLAATLTSEMGNQDKLLKYIASCRDMGIEVRPPSVNVSRREFTVSEGAVVYGLGGIKNVGDEAIREIVEAREEEGEFSSYLDLCCRVNLRKVTKRVQENLIKAGAMDCFGVSRNGLLASIETVVARAQKKAKEKNDNQMSFMSLMPQEDLARPGIGFDCTEQTMEEWDDDQKLRYEKEALGLYLSSHPLFRFRTNMRRLNLKTVEDCEDMNEMEVSLGAIITSRKEIFTKKGDRMCFLGVEDLTGSCEAVVFPKTYAEYKEHLVEDLPLLIKATVQIEGDSEAEEDEDLAIEVKLLVDEVKPLVQAFESSDLPLLMDDIVPGGRFDAEGIAELKSLIGRNNGPARLQLWVSLDDKYCKIELGSDYSVMPGPEFEREFRSWTRNGH